MLFVELIQEQTLSLFGMLKLCCKTMTQNDTRAPAGKEGFLQHRQVLKLPHCPQQNTKAFDIMTIKTVALFTLIFIWQCFQMTGITQKNDLNKIISPLALVQCSLGEKEGRCVELQSLSLWCFVKQ